MRDRVPCCRAHGVRSGGRGVIVKACLAAGGGGGGVGLAAADSPPGPPELEQLNAESRALYRIGREAELRPADPVIIVSGDELVLRAGGRRTAVTVVPPEYHA